MSPVATTTIAPLTLRSRQIAALKQLINLNAPVSDSIAVEPVWKILIFDKYGQDVISPLLTVKDLRDLGVTLHLSLDKARDALPDVPAVYFVSPTEENVAVLQRDLSGGLYESYYFNFISALSRPLLEDLAMAAVQNQCVQQVAKVYDQYVNFISLEDNLFTLRRYTSDCPLSYYGLNRADMTEESMDFLLNQIVDGLFSVCVTLGTVPIIRAPRGNAAEHVAERLDRKIRDNLRDARNNLFTADNIRAGQVNFQRPVLIILDRSIDLATMLHHTWTYQALVHDVLELDINRVTISEAAASTPTSTRPNKVKEYDLNVNDKFWMLNKGKPFPEVAEAVQEELERYRNSEAEVKRLKSAMGLEGDLDDEAISMLSDTSAATAKLTSTVGSLPELLEKKRRVDMHTNVASAVLECIKHRKLDEYFELEEKLFNQAAVGEQLVELLRDTDGGEHEDKLRLLLLYYMTAANVPSQSELTTLSTHLEATGIDMSALKYAKRWRSFAKMLSSDQYTGGGTKTVGMFSKLLTSGSQFVMEGVKNLVIKRHNLPVTKIVDGIMELKQMHDLDDYRYFDPKLLRSNDNALARHRSPFNEAIVFMIGGGNYVEYQNLHDYAQRAATKLAATTQPGATSAATPKKITYGCTDLVNAQQFVSMMSRLGAEI